MYLLNAEKEIDWVLGLTTNIVLLSDLDLLFIDPLGAASYVVAPIAADRFTAPTEFVEGAASYLFTPDIEGLWKIRLVKGTADNYTVLSKVEMYVFDNTTVVNPYSPEIGKPVPYDISYFMQGYMVPNEMIGSYLATRDITLAENDSRNRAVADLVPQTTEQQFIIKHNGLDVGLIVFAIGATIGVVTISPVLLLIGDVLQIFVKGGTIDWDIRDVSVTLVGCSNVVDCALL